MPGIIGKKLGMTSIYSAEGKNLPCTLVECGPCVVTQVKTVENDGYSAVQLAYGERKEKNTPKLVEFDGFEDVNLGDEINATLFEEGEFVDVVGTSKGKGFQGVVKRHNFKGVGDATHGQHNRLRAPGSIGAASYPARVFKGMKMAGQMGNERVKMTNLKVLKVLEDKNVLVIKGSVPGPKGSYVILEK